MAAEYREEDFITLSAVQHFAFCRRQWALLYLEQVWQDNILTVQGELLHEKAHDAYVAEKRKDLIVSFGMPVISLVLGIQGVCDIVEFKKANDGVSLAGRKGKYVAAPLEYKRGRKRADDADRAQLCAQALCLEEMLCININTGYIFHHAERHREEVNFTADLRQKTKKIIAEIRSYQQSGHTPKAKLSRACESCSVKDLCIPQISQSPNVRSYIDAFVSGI